MTLVAMNNEIVWLSAVEKFEGKDKFPLYYVEEMVDLSRIKSGH
jgi:hypothetical protein